MDGYRDYTGGHGRREGIVYYGEAREGDRLAVLGSCVIVVNPTEPPLIIDHEGKCMRALTPEDFPEVYAEFKQRVWFSE